MRTLITGGRIVTAGSEAVGDVLVADGRIALVGEALDEAADRTIDARGCHVLPGAIDPHTHMEMPFGGTVTADDFTSGTRAAACGGTTTIVDFCLLAARRHAERRPGRLAREGRPLPAGGRRRVPHRGGRRGGPRSPRRACGASGPGGRDELQAVHGLSRLAHGRRRHDVPGHAHSGEQRSAPDGPRRERRRDRRAGGGGARRRARGTAFYGTDALPRTNRQRAGAAAHIEDFLAGQRQLTSRG